MSTIEFGVAYLYIIHMKSFKSWYEPFRNLFVKYYDSLYFSEGATGQATITDSKYMLKHPFFQACAAGLHLYDEARSNPNSGNALSNYRLTWATQITIYRDRYGDSRFLNKCNALSDSPLLTACNQMIKITDIEHVMSCRRALSDMRIYTFNQSITSAEVVAIDIDIELSVKVMGSIISVQIISRRAMIGTIFSPCALHWSYGNQQIFKARAHEFMIICLPVAPIDIFLICLMICLLAAAAAEHSSIKLSRTCELPFVTRFTNSVIHRSLQAALFECGVACLLPWRIKSGSYWLVYKCCSLFCKPANHSTCNLHCAPFKAKNPFHDFGKSRINMLWLQR